MAIIAADTAMASTMARRNVLGPKRLKKGIVRGRLYEHTTATIVAMI
jgi:hypothetical protein